MKKIDSVKAYKRYGVELAISFIKTYAEMRIKNRKEPTRAGIKKGEPIGSSKKKYHAALLCVLYPNCLKLKEIAEISGVSERVLLTWRTQKDFVRLMQKEYNLLGKRISNRIESLMHGREIDLIAANGGIAVISNGTLKILKSAKKLDELIKAHPPEGGISKVVELDDAKLKDFKQEKDPIEIVKTFVLILVSLNNAVSLPFIESLKKNLDNNISLYSSLGLLTFKMLHAYDEKSLRDWETQPAMLEVTKMMIQKDIEFLTDPETWERGLKSQKDRELILESAKVMKKHIFDKLDLFAK